MSIVNESVIEALGQIDIFYFELIDQSKYHIGHIGNLNKGGHFTIIIVSNDFMGQKRLQRHRLVYQKLAKFFTKEIHALNLQLYTIEEWNEMKNSMEKRLCLINE